MRATTSASSSTTASTKPSTTRRHELRSAHLSHLRKHHFWRWDDHVGGVLKLATFASHAEPAFYG